MPSPLTVTSAPIARMVSPSYGVSGTNDEQDYSGPMPRSILFVHAHPDDESIGTGATMAHYIASGAQVTLVTCTLGEEGEIHVPELEMLVAGQADQLGGYRVTELRA